MRLNALPVRDFIDRLASSDPTPGGGSAAAAAGAMGAALVRMVALLTAGSPKFVRFKDQAERIARDAAALCDAFVNGVDEDAAAYDGVSRALRLPKETDEQKSARSAQIQTALAEAAQPPLRVAELARDVCALAVELVEFGSPSAISDVGCAAIFASAAARGAAYNVEINAKSLRDKDAAKQLMDRLTAVSAQVGLLSEVVLGKVAAAVEPE